MRYTYSSANWVTPDKHEQVMEQMKVWFCAEPIVTGAAKLIKETISIAYKDNGSTGIFAIGGDKNGVMRSGDSLLFDECADEARLYSATGALVASAQRANALSVAGLAKGIYVLKLTKGGAVRSLKVEF